MKPQKPPENPPDKNDLTQLAKDLEGIVRAFYKSDERPGMAIALTLPPGFDEVHWVTNLTRENGIRLFEATAEKMRAKSGPTS